MFTISYASNSSLRGSALLSPVLKTKIWEVDWLGLQSPPGGILIVSFYMGDDDPGVMDVAHLVARTQGLVTVSFFRNFGLTESSVKHVGMLLKHALAIASNRRPLFTKVKHVRMLSKHRRVAEQTKLQNLPFDDDSPQLPHVLDARRIEPVDHFAGAYAPANSRSALLCLSATNTTVSLCRRRSKPATGPP